MHACAVGCTTHLPPGNTLGARGTNTARGCYAVHPHRCRRAPCTTAAAHASAQPPPRVAPSCGGRHAPHHMPSDKGVVWRHPTRTQLWRVCATPRAATRAACATNGTREAHTALDWAAPCDGRTRTNSPTRSVHPAMDGRAWGVCTRAPTHHMMPRHAGPGPGHPIIHAHHPGQRHSTPTRMHTAPLRVLRTHHGIVGTQCARRTAALPHGEPARGTG